MRGGWEDESGNRVSLEDGVAINHQYAEEHPDLLLPLKRFKGVYNTYFESTKTSSDEFIGQLGLGSKSPYSYAATFNVESRFNGEKRIYTCFKNEERKPTIALMSAQPTDEPNGITVSFSVKSADVSKFEYAAKRMLMYFNPKPNVLNSSGFTPHRIKHTVTGTNWRVRQSESGSGMTGAYVVQGFVAYPIDHDLLVQNGLEDSAAGLAAVDLDMYVDIGAVGVAASREALSYDQRTISNLIDEFRAAASEMRTSFQKSFDECKTMHEAKALHSRFSEGRSKTFSRIYMNMHKEQPFTFDGQEVQTSVRLLLNNIHHHVITRVHPGRNNKLKVDGKWHPTASTAREFEFEIRCNQFVVIDNSKPGSSATIYSWLSKKPEVDGFRATAVVIKPMGKVGDATPTERDQLLAALGDPDVVKASDMPWVQTTHVAGGARVSTYVKRATKAEREARKLVWNGFAQKRGRYGSWRTIKEFTKRCWNTESIPNTQGGFCVPLGTGVHNSFAPELDFSASNFDEVLKLAIKLKIIESTDKIIGMQKNDARMVDQGNWVNVIEYIRTAIPGVIGPIVEFKALKLFDNNLQRIKSTFVCVWDRVKQNMTECAYKQAIQDVVDTHATLAAAVVEQNDVNMLCSYLNVPIDSGQVLCDRLVDQINHAEQAYPMLKLIAQHSTSNADIIVDYVNLIEAQRS